MKACTNQPHFARDNPFRFGGRSADLPQDNVEPLQAQPRSSPRDTQIHAEDISSEIPLHSPASVHRQSQPATVEDEVLLPENCSTLGPTNPSQVGPLNSNPVMQPAICSTPTALIVPRSAAVDEVLPEVDNIEMDSLPGQLQNQELLEPGFENVYEQSYCNDHLEARSLDLGSRPVWNSFEVGPTFQAPFVDFHSPAAEFHE
ncbi:unnamed protein product [Calypogeia fissa]